MSALLITPCLEVSCRNDAGAGVGDRVAVLEWADPRRETEGRATAPITEAASHLLRLAGPLGQVNVRLVGEGTVHRVIQWKPVAGPSGPTLPARVVVRLDGPT